MRHFLRFSSLLLLMTLTACGGVVASRSGSTITHAPRTVSAQGAEVVMFAMSLIDTGYRFGGKNPEAGLDCSGMVSYVYSRAAGIKVTGSAADIARRGRAVERDELRPGDLVFFNTMNRPFSHVGIYIGNNRFVHAPSTNGRVRIERLDNLYFVSRYEAARTLLD